MSTGSAVTSPETKKIIYDKIVAALPVISIPFIVMILACVVRATISCGLIDKCKRYCRKKETETDYLTPKDLRAILNIWKDGLDTNQNLNNKIKAADALQQTKISNDATCPLLEDTQTEQVRQNKDVVLEM